MEYNVEVPIYVQVVRDIKKRIVRGKLLPGEKLPSNRELAVLYKVNPNTAARIYKEMEAEGYCYTKRDLEHSLRRTNRQEELRKEMASTVEGLLKEMKDLGFGREEIISRIEHFDEEEEV